MEQEIKTWISILQRNLGSIVNWVKFFWATYKFSANHTCICCPATIFVCTKMVGQGIISQNQILQFALQTIKLALQMLKMYVCINFLQAYPSLNRLHNKYVHVQKFLFKIYLQNYTLQAMLHLTRTKSLFPVFTLWFILYPKM